MRSLWLDFFQRILLYRVFHKSILSLSFARSVWVLFGSVIHIRVPIYDEKRERSIIEIRYRMSKSEWETERKKGHVKLIELRKYLVRIERRKLDFCFSIILMCVCVLDFNEKNCSGSSEPIYIVHSLFLLIPRRRLKEGEREERKMYSVSKWREFDDSKPVCAIELRCCTRVGSRYCKISHQ